MHGLGESRSRSMARAGGDAVLGLGLVLTLGGSRRGVTASRRRSSSVFPGHLSWQA